MSSSVWLKRLNFNLYRAHCNKKYSVAANVKAKPKEERDELEGVVGLEIHAQIFSKTKLFSGSTVRYNAPVNSQVSFFDAGHPGTLPVLNRRCVEAAVLTSIALGCHINKKSVFDRKHYFYADLPIGYQITQQRLPLAVNGKLTFITFNPTTVKIPYVLESKIKQIQLEQDSGKSLHDPELGLSLIDLNRAGAPLMEFVFEPDLHTGEEAASLIRELRLILQRIGTCDGKMEEGSLRVDANVSVRKVGQETLGTRTEIKNLNSARAVANAIHYEIERQKEIVRNGGTVQNETLMYDTKSKRTILMRDKEKVQDYRFMPEPNLPPLLLCDCSDEHPDRINIDNIRQQLPELPIQVRQRMMDEYGVPLQLTIQIVMDDILLKYFNELIKIHRSDGKLIASILLSEFPTSLKKFDVASDKCCLPSSAFAKVIELFKNGVIARGTIQLIMDELIKGDQRAPKEIVEANDWRIITDRKRLTEVCEDVMRNSESVIKSRKTDESKIFNTLVSRVRKETNNRADIKIVMEIIKELLANKSRQK